MKKRLLSAALALAMVLTMLPVSAFAAAPSGFTALNDDVGVSVSYYKKDAKVGNIEIPQDGWYHIDANAPTQYYADDGVVVTSAAMPWTSGNGTWYQDAMTAILKGQSSFTLLSDDDSIKAHTGTLSSLTINLNGNKLTWGISAITKESSLTTLTITDSLDTAGTIKSGSEVDGDIIAGQNSAGNGKNFTLNLTNVKMASGKAISIYHVGSGTVNVTNAEVGAVTVKSVPVSGTVRTSGGKVAVSGALASAGAISVDSTSGGDVDVTNVSSNKITSIELKGYNTTLDIASSLVGAVTVFGTEDSTQAAQRAAAINVSGLNCVVDSIKKTTDTGEQLTSGVTLNITQSGNAKEVELPNATIRVEGGRIETSLKLGQGSVSLGTKNAANRSGVGAVELGSAGYGTVTMTVAEQGNVGIGAVTEASGNAKTITVTIPAHPTNPSLDNNTVTSVKATTLANWTKNTIAGGKFTTAITADDRPLLNSGLLFEEMQGNVTTYWPSERINELVAYWKSSDTTKIIGTSSSTNTATLYKGGNTASDKVLEFKYDAVDNITIQLPSTVGGVKIVEWNKGAGTTSTWGGGASYTLLESPTDAKEEFFADSEGYTVSKVTDVAVPLTGGNPGVTASLSGTVISLSGPVSGVMAGQNTATIDLRLKTDAGDVDVKVAWVPATKSLTFSSDPSDQTFGSMRLADSGKAIQLTVNNTKYTLRDAGLTVEAVGLEFDGNTSTDKAEVVATSTAFTGTNAATNNENLAKAMSGGEVDFSGSPAVLEAFGAAIAGINKSQVDAWRTQAQNQAFQKEHGRAPTNDTERAGTGYSNVVAVLYLDVRVSQWSDAATPGSLTAVMAPYMRVEVRHTNKDPIVVRTGQPLRALTSEVGEVAVKLLVGDTYKASGNVAHQNGTYVYEVTATNASSGTPASAEFTITHAAANGSGFGTIVFNAVSAPVEVKKPDSNTPAGFESYSPKKLYDTIQAAVDDAKNGEQVAVISPMNQNFPITMSGDARTIYIDTDGNATVSNATSNNVVFAEKTNGHDYTIQLTKSTAVVKPTEGDVTITVASVTNGRASVSASKANAGDTITVTSTPNTGYASGGLTIRTDTGAAVSYATTGTNASTRVTTYTFKVPEGAKSITVTPAFAASNTGATVTVSNTSYGTATTSAGANKVAPGTTVSVATSPSTGYRTMGLYVTSNSGNATATRTGANSFTFTVPSNATSVVVTPRFDLNNGTLFEDVWSTEYYSAPVAWAVGRGITNGTSTYTFGSNNSCTRADMVTFLYRAAGSPAVTNVSNPFWDVQPGTYYYNAVLWAVSKGITNGVSANQFGVNQYVSRAQAVTFLYRYNGSPAASTYSGFYDVPASEYYAKAVAWANTTGVTNGTSTTLFSPNNAVSRAQAVTFLYRNATGVRA